MNEDIGSIILITTLVMAFPFIVVGTTAFIKIATVLFVLRNALGLQQAPPNMALYGITLCLVAFIHAPIVIASYDAVMLAPFDAQNPLTWGEAIEAGVAPFSTFMLQHTSDEDLAFFLDAAKRLYSGSRLEVSKENFLVLLPAFMNAELTAAFQIGVLIFLPFLAIDIIVTNILTALGMMMVTPMVISLPFKVLLFVAVDGWSKLTHSLILSYVPV